MQKFLQAYPKQAPDIFSTIVLKAEGAVDSLEGAWVLVILYGFFGAGIQSMFPPILTNL